MFVPAPISKRIFAGIIDYAILMLMAIILSLIFKTDWRYATFFAFVDTDGGQMVFGTLSFVPIIIFTLFYLGYFTTFETISGTSIGKNLVGLIIIREDGSPVGLREALIRTLFRATDGAPLWYIMGIIAIILSPTRQRIGDHLAQAIVVEKATVISPVPVAPSAS
jgi:uncharacterized RDD family membrane protein YckC